MRTIIIGIIALVSGIIAALGWSFTQKQEVVAPTQTEPTKPSPILPAILEAKNMKVTTPTPQATINSPVTLICEARTF